MLYKEIKTMIPEVVFRSRDTTNLLTRMPMESFTDRIKLYLYLCGLVKSFGIGGLDVKPVKKDDAGKTISKEFSAKTFTYVILSKGSLVNNDAIAKNLIVELAGMLEEYIESHLKDKEPQLTFFAQFAEGNFEGMRYVFKTDIVGSTSYIEYENKKGKLIVISDKMAAVKFNKDDTYDLYENYELPNQIKVKLERLKLGSFPKWKKHVMAFCSEHYAGFDVLENGDINLELDKDLAALEEQLILKDKKDK